MKLSRARVGRVTVLAGMVLALVGNGPVSAAVCANSAESEALSARVLQTELIVAALSCGENKRYKAFVGRFEKELTKRAGVMKKYFARSHGGRASKELNQFVTSLANEASQRSLAEAGSFCANASELFESILKVEPKNLAEFASARPSAASHGLPVCAQAKSSNAAAVKPKADSGSTSATRTAENKPQAAGKGSGS